MGHEFVGWRSRICRSRICRGYRGLLCGNARSLQLGLLALFAPAVQGLWYHCRELGGAIRGISVEAMSDRSLDAATDPSSAEVARFYPSIIPPEEGHPTSDQFEVVDTGDERGQGLRAKVAFQRGERVARLSGVLVNHTMLETIQISPTLHLHDPWFCRFLLHSCDPNLTIDTTAMEARAAKDIKPGDYLSIDYAATEDFLSSQFACHCGAANCRGWMTGRREEPNEDGRCFLAQWRGA